MPLGRSILLLDKPVDRPGAPSIAPSLFELRDIIRPKFSVLDAYVDMYGIATFIVSRGPTKENFKSVTKDLVALNLMPVLRAEKANLILRIIPRPPVGKPRVQINFVLFLTTLVTIFIAGYTLVSNIPILRDVLMKETNLFLQAALFAGSLIAIIGLHELGHKAACRIHGLEATLPYFIPGPPPFGTFGALISLKSPPTNKDQLFDLGFSGPFVGFIVTILVAILSFQTGFLVPVSEAAKWEEMQLVQRAQWPLYPLLFDLLAPFARPVPQGFSLIFTQIEFAAWVGALLTFLNILPIWQLDGGHISRAMFGPDGHKVATGVGIGVLILTGYWFFALFLMLWMFSGRRNISGVEPLDDVSPLTRSRKLLYLFSLAMLVLCFVMIPFRQF